MIKYRALLLVLIAFVALPGRGTAAGDAARLDTIANRYWSYEVGTSYGLQMQLGVAIQTLRAPTFAAAQEDGRFGARVLRDLAGIDSSRLDHDRWLTYRALQYDAQGLVGDRTYFWYEQQITPYRQQYAYMLPVFTSFHFSSPADGRRYLSLLHDLAGWTRSLQTFAAGQHARHIILPDVETDAAVGALKGYAGPLESSPYTVEPKRLSQLAPAAANSLQASIRNELQREVIPSFAALIAYLNGPYRQSAPSGVGQSQYPGGRAYYAYMVERNTTLDLTPQQIHAIGLREVARINSELDDVRRGFGFKGNLAEFHTYLKTNRRFFAETGAQIGDRLQSFVNRVAMKVPAYYDSLPKAPYGVAPLPANLAGSQTFGYYDQPTPAKPRGVYLYNAAHPKTTWLPQSGALIMHELIPGHHFQIALQLENTTLPPVRRYDFGITGFVEGYAEYASQLGFDMGMYSDPYDRVGRLMQDMMVSSRLVVDTGMNSMGWTRERAERFMRENTILADNQIGTETLRYSTDLPAQALGYKLGELTLLQLRDEAKARLGRHYDIRQFHRWLIGSGTMTLATLREHMKYEETHAAGH